MILAGVDAAECTRCDLLTRRRELPEGVAHHTTSRMVNHVAAPMDPGTPIAGPREHIVAVADLDSAATAQLRPVPRATARVVEAICQPEQTYVLIGA